MNNHPDSDKKLNIWQISREMASFAEAGGIKDVVSGLSEALTKLRHNITVVLPMYKFLKHFKIKESILKFQLNFGDGLEEIQVFETQHHFIRILLISASCFETKDLIYTYSREEELKENSHVYGTGHHDCHKMNLVLQRSTLEIAYKLEKTPDLFHLHDGHTGFLPAIMKNNIRYNSYFKNTSTLLTIHNAGTIYQQNITDLEEAITLTELPLSVLKNIQTESGYSPLLCAGIYGHINTVSENYALEILGETNKSSGYLGATFVKKKIDFKGITNGIDTDKYKEPLFKHNLKPSLMDKNMIWKREYKQSLFDKLNSLKQEKIVFGDLIYDFKYPLFTMQSRITYQKGVDVFCDCLITLLDKTEKINFLIIGEGEKVYEDRLISIAENRSNFCYVRKYDEVLSQHLFAAGDFFLIPSRWEPCGLTDFIAQLFGNIPIVHETGGLVKIKNKINGFSYKNNNAESLSQKILEAVSFYRNNTSFLHDIRVNAVNLINENYTWEKVVINRYIPYYREILQ